MYKYYLLFYLILNFKCVFSSHNKNDKYINPLILINNNTSFILPTDDSYHNYGDRAEYCGVEFKAKAKLLYRHIYINEAQITQSIYKFEKSVSAELIITEARFINIGRQRGFVRTASIVRDKIDEDLVCAEIVVQPNEQFRLLTEIYAYDPNVASRTQLSWILLPLYALILNY